MRKNQYYASKSPKNIKASQKTSVAFPKKQFELIYRQRDPSPSSQAFQSIIFMKSKKCDNKSNACSKKNNKNNNNQPVQELHKVIRQLQKQIQEKQTQNIRMQECSKRTNKMKNHKNDSCYDAKVLDQEENKYLKSIYKSPKSKKTEAKHQEKLKKYRKIISPSKKQTEKSISISKLSKNKKKTHENLKSTQRQQSDYARNIQYNYSLKKNDLIFEEDIQQYVFIENEFIYLDHGNSSMLKTKMLESTRANFFQTQMISNKQTNLSSYNKSQKEKNTVEDFHNTREICNKVQIFDESEVQSEIDEESIVKIQKWWRKMFSKKIKRCAQFSDFSPIKNQKQENKIDHVLNISQQQSFIFELNSHDAQSPIKIVDEISFDKYQVDTMQAITIRENAVKNQFQTYKNLLQDLKLRNKINHEAYNNRLAFIQRKFQRQSQEIKQLKQILIKNAQKAQEISKRTSQNMKRIQDIDKPINDDILDEIFGTQSIKKQQTACQFPNHLQNFIVNRQKSTGCHYESEKSKNSIYSKKIQAEDEQYVEEFQQQSSDLSDQSQALKNQRVTNMTPINCANAYQQFMSELKTRQQIKFALDKRAAKQMGVLIQENNSQQQKIGIDTSLNSIHKFLLTFFKYYIFYYKYEFLRLINMPYGHNVDKRLKSLQGYSTQNEEQEEVDEEQVIYGISKIIPEEIFYEFYEKMLENAQLETKAKAKKTNFQLQKIHNKALFDTFNQALNVFRPYYQIGGPPYPWNYSQKALTFYFIAEENLQEVFQKTQFKVLKWASSLCGIYLQNYQLDQSDNRQVQSADDTLSSYLKAHPLINETREDRESKNEKTQIQESHYLWSNYDESKTDIFINLSDHLLSTLICEVMSEFKEMQRSQYFDQI